MFLTGLANNLESSRSPAGPEFSANNYPIWVADDVIFCGGEDGFRWKYCLVQIDSDKIIVGILPRLRVYILVE